jgi:hypothetical protein
MMNTKMRTRILLASLFPVLVGTIVWLVLTRSEPNPSFEGRRLSDWLEDLDRWNGADTNSAVVVAIRTIGTNGIPMLVRMSLLRDSAVKDMVSVEFEKHPKLLRYRYTTAAQRWSRAGQALSIMGEPARAAIPYFLQALTNGDAVTRRIALNALGSIGPNAEDCIPLLLARQQDTEAFGNLLGTLGHIGRRPDLCVPVLTKALENTNSYVRTSAAQALGQFGSQAKDAIPGLTRALADKQTARAAKAALKKIQSAQEASTKQE